MVLLPFEEALTSVSSLCCFWSGFHSLVLVSILFYIRFVTWVLVVADSTDCRQMAAAHMTASPDAKDQKEGNSPQDHTWHMACGRQKEENTWNGQRPRAPKGHRPTQQIADTNTLHPAHKITSDVCDRKKVKPHRDTQCQWQTRHRVEGQHQKHWTNIDHKPTHWNAANRCKE